MRLYKKIREWFAIEGDPEEIFEAFVERINMEEKRCSARRLGGTWILDELKEAFFKNKEGYFEFRSSTPGKRYKYICKGTHAFLAWKKTGKSVKACFGVKRLLVDNTGQKTRWRLKDKIDEEIKSILP